MGDGMSVSEVNGLGSGPAISSRPRRRPGGAFSGVSAKKRAESAKAADLQGTRAGIKTAQVRLAGDGGLVVVGYTLDGPLDKAGLGAHCIIDQSSGRRLDLQGVPLIGPLMSRPIGRSRCLNGYFVVDNCERVVVPGSVITVVVGGLRKEDVIVAR